MLGGGFPAHTVARGIALGADVIAVDGGSTDSGPYYLGTGTPKTTDEAVEHDLARAAHWQPRREHPGHRRVVRYERDR